MTETMNGRSATPPVLPQGKRLIDIIDLTQTTYGQAKKLGLKQELYQLARRLAFIKQRRVATLEEEAVIEKALRTLEMTGSVRVATEVAAPILEKYWVRKTQTGMPVDKRSSAIYRASLKRFENTLFAIREACSNNDEMEIPTFLMREERDEHAKMLVCVIEDLWDLHDDIIQQPRRRRT